MRTTSIRAAVQQILIQILLCLFEIAKVNGEELSERSILLEWEKVSSAFVYEIELTGDHDFQKVFETKEAYSKLNIKPGLYRFRVRAKDRRGLTGPWSTPNELQVKVALVRYLTPALNWETVAPDEKPLKIKFSWSSAAGAKKYLFTLEGEGSSEKTEIKTELLELDVDVQPGGKYQWSVQSLSEDDKTSDQIKWSFTILSQAMTKPQFKMPETSFVRELNWKVEKYVDAIDVQFLRYEVESQSWRMIDSPRTTAENPLIFPSHWKGGKYRLVTWAKKNGKTISGQSMMEFEVHEGDRSTLSEARFILSDYLQRDKGLFVFSDYRLSQVKYEGWNPFLNSKSEFAAMAGHLNMGAERLIANNYGLRGILGVGGIIIENKNQLLKTFSVEAVSRFHFTDLADSRAWFGITYQESPEISVSLTRSINEIYIIKATGLSFGGESWKAFTSHWGGKIQGNFIIPMVGKNSYGDLIEKTLGTQWGILTTYNFSPQYQIHFGYSLKEDLLKFKQNVNLSDQAQIKIKGSYFKFEFGMEL